jgi:hypothetical protein
MEGWHCHAGSDFELSTRVKTTSLCRAGDGYIDAIGEIICRGLRVK